MKVVVLGMFEPGEDRDDVPGELQLWVERKNFDRFVPLPAGHHGVWVRDDGLVATNLGVGHAKAAASAMALGLDPRFDFTKAYWLITGIAGVDPEDASLASAAIARYVVNGGLAHEIDARDIPFDWKTGLTALGTATPFTPQSRNRDRDLTQVHRLNPELANWAYELTRDLSLPENEEMIRRRRDFAHLPRASEPPRVLLGDVLSSSRYWHGERMNAFANEWTSFWTQDDDPAAEFVMSSMEDAGTLQALRQLDEAGHADWSRILVIRTASNFTMESPDMTAAQSLARERGAAYSAYRESLESAYIVGDRILESVLAHWSLVEYETPDPGLTLNPPNSPNY